MPQAPAITKDAPASGGAAPLAIVPFTRATFEHAEPSNFDKSNLMTTSSIQLGPEDVIAYGFLRSLFVLVEASGGAAGLNNAVYKEDAPWSVIEELALIDVNGAQIVGPITGYDLYLINVFGGYSGMPDPASWAAYTTPPTSGNFTFALRVPVELSSRDGLGSMSNMNSSSTYKLRVVQSPIASVFSTAPDTKPTIRIRVWLEAWAGPQAQSAAGSPQAQLPPGIGTTQFWTPQSYLTPSGDYTVQLKRVGNLIRNLILVFRNTSDGLRSTTNLPDPVQLWIDGKLVTNEGKLQRRTYMTERLNARGITVPAGVYVFDFTHDFDGLYGGEMRDLWLPTASSTRLEVKGSFGAAGTLRVLTNDVAPVGNIYIG
jgi:hypothetical protein